eukprot:jgi/Tetstr1/460369/TSEL_005668.t1
METEHMALDHGSTPRDSRKAAERPDLLEPAQSGRVGAKSASDEDDYLALPLLLGQRQRSQGVAVDVAAVAGVVEKEAFGSDELGPRALDLLSSSIIALPLKSYAGRLSRFAELCHDSENISPLEATTVTVVQTRADRSKEAFNKQTVFMWKDTVAEGCNTVKAWGYTTFGHVQLLFRLSQHSTVSKTEEGYIQNSTFSFSVWIVPNCANSESRMTSAMATYVGDGAPKVEISADTFTILPPNADYGAYAKHEATYRTTVTLVASSGLMFSQSWQNSANWESLPT